MTYFIYNKSSPINYSISMRKIIHLLLLSGALHTSLAHADLATGFTAAENLDFATALKEWKPLAATGDATAQFNLGVLYSIGQGVPQD